MNRVIHFEIHAASPKNLSKFYSGVFGWEIKEWVIPGIKDENRYWEVHTAPEESKEPGINGGMVFRKGPLPQGGEPVTAFICTIQVPSIDDYLKKVTEAGGSTSIAKMPIPGMAWLAYCKDPEGNIFGIYEEDKEAKQIAYFYTKKQLVISKNSWEYFPFKGQAKVINDFKTIRNYCTQFIQGYIYSR